MLRIIFSPFPPLPLSPLLATAYQAAVMLARYFAIELCINYVVFLFGFYFSCLGYVKPYRDLFSIATLALIIFYKLAILVMVHLII